jgi:hypothetical protein
MNPSFHVLNNITTDTKGSKQVTVKTIIHEKLIITVMFSVLADGRKLTFRGSVAWIQTEIKLPGNFCVNCQYQILNTLIDENLDIQHPHYSFISFIRYVQFTSQSRFITI